MSSEEQKFLHSQRIMKKDASIRRQTKIAKTFGLNKYVKEPHRLAKHHALDCGQPDCKICSNGRKTDGERSIQEKRMFQDKLHFDLHHEVDFYDYEDTIEYEERANKKTLEIPRGVDN